MKAMRKCNDKIYQLAKDQALVKKLKKKKRFRPFCLCLPDVMFVTRGSKNSPLPEMIGDFSFAYSKWRLKENLDFNIYLNG